MNVSLNADREFITALEQADPPRHDRLMRSIRRANPGMSMPEDQALTNFMLGLPTAQYRFAIIAGPGAPLDPLRVAVDEALHNGTVDEYVKAIVAYASAPWPKPTATEPVSADAPSVRKTRHFAHCLGCGRKFLQKRADNVVCSGRCQKRAHRRTAMSDIPEITLPKAA